jgi:hypothetical protein
MCIYLTKVVGVAAIPPSAFYSPENQVSVQCVVCLLCSECECGVKCVYSRKRKRELYFPFWNHTQHLAKNVVRFGFCKEDTVLLQARDKFRAFFNKQ